MPLYEYLCRDCGDRFEVLQRLGEGPDGLACPDCGARILDKQFSTFATAGGSSAAQADVAGIADAAACDAADCGAGACCGGGSCGLDSFN